MNDQFLMRIINLSVADLSAVKHWSSRVTSTSYRNIVICRAYIYKPMYLERKWKKRTSVFGCTVHRCVLLFPRFRIPRLHFDGFAYASPINALRGIFWFWQILVFITVCGHMHTRNSGVPPPPQIFFYIRFFFWGGGYWIEEGQIKIRVTVGKGVYVY